MKKKIISLTGNNKFFGQTRKPWVSLDYDKIEKILNDNGYIVDQYEFHEVLNKDINIKDSFIFYSFSQKAEIRRYISDVLLYLSKFNNRFIPNLELHRCHENKGFQELYKRMLGIHSLNAFYFSNIMDLDDYEFEYPIVLKTVEGSNGNGVFLIKNEEELFKTINKIEQVSFTESIDLLRRKYFRKKKCFKEYPDYCNEVDFFEYRDYISANKRFVLQEFIPNLKWDYRVLIIFDHYYITKRHVRENDFRASGAKKFDFNFEPDPQILNYAKDVFDKFDSPFLSIDIAYDGEKCYLLEYQALHFGINVLVKSPGFYTNKNNNWELNRKKPQVEEDLTYGLVQYLNKTI